MPLCSEEHPEPQEIGNSDFSLLQNGDELGTECGLGSSAFQQEVILPMLDSLPLYPPCRHPAASVAVPILPSGAMLLEVQEGEHDGQAAAPGSFRDPRFIEYRQSMVTATQRAEAEMLLVDAEWQASRGTPADRCLMVAALQRILADLKQRCLPPCASGIAAIPIGQDACPVSASEVVRATSRDGRPNLL